MKPESVSLRTKRVFATLCLAALALAGAITNAMAQVPSGSKPNVVVVETKHVSAVVQDVDYQTRMVTLKRSDGKIVTLRVDERARNLDQVKKGDRVKATYYSSTRILVREPDGGMGSSQSETVELAPRGHKPSGVFTTTASGVGTVIDIDYKKRIAKVQGPDGNIVTVQATPDMTHFNEVQKGDQVLVEVTESIAVSVKK